MSAALLTEQTIDAIAAAVFDRPDAWVVEAYSDYDAPPLKFESAAELAQYAKRKLAEPKGSAFVFVTYPDMFGAPVRRTIHLKPGSVPGHKLRYTWEGWGLISILLEGGDQRSRHSHVAANSEKRAAKWQSTNPNLDPPSTWNWKAVAGHVRRLQRVLKKVA